MIARVKIPQDIRHTEVEVNGQRIERAVRSLTIEANAMERPVIRLKLGIVTDIDATGEVELYMTEHVRDALALFGWTPPAGEL